MLCAAPSLSPARPGLRQTEDEATAGGVRQRPPRCRGCVRPVSGSRAKRWTLPAAPSHAGAQWSSSGCLIRLPLRGSAGLVPTERTSFLFHLAGHLSQGAQLSGSGLARSMWPATAELAPGSGSGSARSAVPAGAWLRHHCRQVACNCTSAAPASSPRSLPASGLAARALSRRAVGGSRACSRSARGPSPSSARRRRRR